MVKIKYMKPLSYLIIAVAAVMTGCSSGAKSGGEADVSDFDFVLLDESKSVGERTIALSELIDDYRVVKFENSDSALFHSWKTVVSPDYILIIQGSQRPVKLFDHEGRYITNVGRTGQGPGEYMGVYDAAIDEKRGAIYLSQYNNGAVLEYNLKGEFVKAHDVKKLFKPTLYINGNSSVSVASLSFQDLDNPISAATFSPGDTSFVSVAYPPLYSSFRNNEGYIIAMDNEIWAYKNTPNNAFMATNNDTLYAYDAAANAIMPRAYLKMSSEKQPGNWFQGNELPGAIAIQVVGDGQRLMWYDKKNGELSSVILVNDYLGNSTFNTNSLRCGYFVQIWEPGMLIDRIEERWLKENEMTDEQRKALEELRDSLDPEANDVLLIGKLK